MMVNRNSATVVAINGSERGRRGSTHAVLERCAVMAATRGAEVTIVDLVELKIGPCGPCGDCNTRTRACEVDDDVPSVVRQMAAADAVLYAAPVHGFGTSSIMSAFIERSGVGYLRFGRPLTNKVGAAIAVGRRYHHGEVYTHLLLNVLLNRMIVPGAGFPPIVYGGSAEEVADDVEGMDMVDRAMERVLDLVDLLRAHRRLTGSDVLVPSTDNERSRVWSATAGSRADDITATPAGPGLVAAGTGPRRGTEES
jgi:multimeric flavodoxin WrbA